MATNDQERLRIRLTKCADVSYLELNILLTATLRRRRGETTKIWWWLRETGNWEEIVGKSVPKKTAFTRSFIELVCPYP